MHWKVLLTLWAVVTVACFANVQSLDTSRESCSPTFSDNDDDWLHGHRKQNHFKDYKGVKTNDVPLPRLLFTSSLEAKINRQINVELFAHYAYLSMAYHFDRDDIKMPGFHKFFLKMAEEEHEHAQMFMKYQNKRGGRIHLKHIHKPCYNGIWGNGTEAMSQALELEKFVNNQLLNLHGSQTNDPQFLDFLESNFLGEQVDSIKQLSDYVNILRRLNSPLGEYEFDKLTLQKDYQ